MKEIMDSKARKKSGEACQLAIWAHKDIGRNIETLHLLCKEIYQLKKENEIQTKQIEWLTKMIFTLVGVHRWNVEKHKEDFKNSVE